jgi:purine-binding chemotaxis protein CheW
MSSDEIKEATQYLTFTLGEEDFALEIAKVREVLDYTTITKVPRMPEFLRGVINLRGNVVPVIDFRLKLGMSAIQRTVDTCIVIVEILIDGELTQMGALADSVKEVIDLDPSQISPPPKLGTKLNNEFIKGMGKQDEKFLIILDIDRVLSCDEWEMLQRTSNSQDTGTEDEKLETNAPIVDLGPESAGVEAEALA